MILCIRLLSFSRKQATVICKSEKVLFLTVEMKLLLGLKC